LQQFFDAVGLRHLFAEAVTPLRWIPVQESRAGVACLQRLDGYFTRQATRFQRRLDPAAGVRKGPESAIRNQRSAINLGHSSLCSASSGQLRLPLPLSMVIAYTLVRFNS
jgi:hypothetical protein